MRATAKIWGARASELSFKFCEQLKILMDHSSPLAKLRIKLQSMENRAHQTVKVSEIAKKNEKHYFFKNFFSKERHGAYWFSYSPMAR